MISLCITGLSDSAIAAVDRALQVAGVAPAQVAQRDADLSFASWHARVYQAADQGQQEKLEGAGSVGEAPSLGRLWEQLASDLFLSNIQKPVWGWADAKSLGLLDYWLTFDASIHFVLVATSPEQMLAEHLSNLALEDAAATKSLADMPIDRLLARWSQAHHAMLRFALRHPARCMLVLADDLEQPVLVEAAKATWPKALKALRVPQKDAKGGVPEAAPSSSDGVLRHFAEQWCEAYPQAKTLHHEIASVAAAANTKNSEKQASEAVLQGVLATVAMARKVPSLLAQVNESERLRDAQLRDAAELKTQLGQEVLAKTQLQSQLKEQAAANSALLQEKTVLAQESQMRAQEAQASKSALEAEVLAKTKAIASLSDEKSQRKSADEERALLLTQLHQVQEDLESYYLKSKELEKENKSLGDAKRDLEAKTKADAAAAAATAKERAALIQEKSALLEGKAKLMESNDARAKALAELREKLEEERKARIVLVSENAKLAQEKAKLIEARDSLAQARAQTQEKLFEASNSRAVVVQEKIALSQKNKELIAVREAEIKRTTELKAQLEDELKAKGLLASENAKLAQEKAKLIAARDSLAIARAEVQEKLSETSKSRAAVVQEKIALSQKNKELIAAREVEVKAKDQALAQLEKETRLRADLETQLQAESQAHANLKQEKTALAQEKATLGQEKTKVIAARDAESKAKAAALEDLAKAKARTKMAEEESALMLAQLHKLQEDAERYDLRIKDLQANLNQATARFRRVTSRQPDGIDWESVQTQPLLVGGRPALQCRATNVAVMGKEWKSLEFVAFIQDGTLAFTFVPNPDAAGTGPLTRLPRGVGSVAQFTARAGKEAQGQPGMELLKDLSTSDWDLLRGLPRLLSLGLQYVRGAWPADMPGPTAWESAAKATLPALLRVPMALRFDVLKLQSASALPTYEHLRLRLDPLSLGKKRFAGFEFRFGCNVGQGNQFGSNARLEFFRGSGTPTFDRWVPNARDGADERLDLVFVFPTSMNLKDWSALSVSDRSLVLLLADQLPTMLAELGPSSVQVARPMAEWIALAEKLRTFVRTRLDVTGVQKQPDALVDAVPGSVPQDTRSAPARRRASSAQAAVSDIKKQRVAAKTPVAAKKAALPAASARSTVRPEAARARKR